MSEVPGVGATTFEPEGPPIGTAVVVPGRGYPPAAPLLFFAGFALLAHGWSVRQVWWDPPAHESDEQTLAWVQRQVEEALPESGRALLVAKSLGTYAAPLAAERGLDAIASSSARQLLVGGTADTFAWAPVTARGLAERGCDVLEVAGADHAMMVPGDAVRGVEVHAEVIRTVDAFLARLEA
jgi:hypothetical protein